MSKNNELEKFKELYTQYLDQMVIVHNQSRYFIKTAARDPGFLIRRALRDMIRLQRQMKSVSAAAYKEGQKLYQERLAQQRIELAHKKANPGKPGRPKKEK